MFILLYFGSTRNYFCVIKIRCDVIVVTQRWKENNKRTRADQLVENRLSDYLTRKVVANYYKGLTVELLPCSKDEVLTEEHIIIRLDSSHKDKNLVVISDFFDEIKVDVLSSVGGITRLEKCRSRYYKGVLRLRPESFHQDPFLFVDINSKQSFFCSNVFWLYFTNICLLCIILFFIFH
jgi:hypothetical protein